MMNNILVPAPVSFPQRNSLRTSRLQVVQDRLVLRVHGQVKFWPIGRGGIVDAVLLVDGYAAAVHGVLSARLPLIFRDAAGSVLVVFDVMDWVQRVGLQNSSAERLSDSGFLRLLADAQIPMTVVEGSESPELIDAMRLRQVESPFHLGKPWLFFLRLGLLSLGTLGMLLSLAKAQSEVGSAWALLGAMGLLGASALDGLVVLWLAILDRRSAIGETIIFPRSTLCLPRAFARNSAVLCVDGTWGVLRNGASGLEQWLSLHGSGGVSSVVVGTDQQGAAEVVLLQTANGERLASLPWRDWFDSPAGQGLVEQLAESFGAVLERLPLGQDVRAEALREAEVFRGQSPLTPRTKRSILVGVDAPHPIISLAAVLMAQSVYQLVTRPDGEIPAVVLVVLTSAALISTAGLRLVRFVLRRYYWDADVKVCTAQAEPPSRSRQP